MPLMLHSRMALQVLLVLLAAILCVTTEELSCKDTTSKLSLSTRKKSSGRQVVQVSMELVAGDSDEKPFQLDFEQRSSKCSQGKTRYISASIEEPTEPPADYELIPTMGRYKLHIHGQIWKDAQKTCEREGGHLAIINSEAELKVLQDIFSRHPTMFDTDRSDFAFLGYNDIAEEGRFVTIFGEDLENSGFARWSNGQPNNLDSSSSDPGQDCIALDRGDLLNDVWCDRKSGFFCEHEL